MIVGTDKHKVWLIVGVAIVIIAVLLLVFYTSKGPVAGKAIAQYGLVSLWSADESNAADVYGRHNGLIRGKVTFPDVTGTIAVSASAGLSETYNFDATTSGNIASMTFENGILTAVTTLP